MGNWDMSGKWVGQKTTYRRPRKKRMVWDMSGNMVDESTANFSNRFNELAKSYTGAQGQRENFLKQLKTEFPEIEEEEISKAIYQNLRSVKEPEKKSWTKRYLGMGEPGFGHLGKVGKTGTEMVKTIARTPKAALAGLIGAAELPVEGAIQAGQTGYAGMKKLLQTGSLKEAHEASERMRDTSKIQPGMLAKKVLPKEYGPKFAEMVGDIMGLKSDAQALDKTLETNRNLTTRLLARAKVEKDPTKKANIHQAIKNIQKTELELIGKFEESIPSGKKVIGTGAEAGLNIATMPLMLGAGQAVKAAPSILSAVGKGAMRAAPWGTAYGAAGALEQEKPMADVGKAALTGGIAGAVLGGGLAGVGKGISQIKSGKVLKTGGIKGMKGPDRRAIIKDLQRTPVKKTIGVTSNKQVNASIKRVGEAMKEMAPARKKHAPIFTGEKARRFAKKEAAREAAGGRLKGYFAELKSMKGKFKKAKFEALKKRFPQSDFDNIMAAIEKSPSLRGMEKMPAKVALGKLFGYQKGFKRGGLPFPSEIKALNKVFGKEFVANAVANRTLWQKASNAGYEVANMPRAIMASFDVSAPFRQGIFMISHPVRFAKNFVKMFRYFGSEKAYKALNKEITSRPTYGLMEKYKLAITGASKPMSGREEQFFSQWAEKIPVLGRGVRASDRAYTGFLNKMRADLFDDILMNSRKSGINVKNPKFLKDLAGFINTASGRGDMGKTLEKAAVPLNTLFFSPKLIASRLKMISPVYYMRLSPGVRKEAMKSLMAYGTLMTTVLGLSKAAGAEVELDPRSSDFAKIKIGNTRIDIAGGTQQYIRVLTQLVTGEQKSTKTGKITEMGEKFGSATRWDTARRFFENKFSPVVSLGMALMKGKTFAGEDVELSKEVLKRFVPMAINDMLGTYDDLGLKGLPIGLTAQIGVGLQTFGKTTGVKDFDQEFGMDRRINDLVDKIVNKKVDEQAEIDEDEKTKQITKLMKAQRDFPEMTSRVKDYFGKKGWDYEKAVSSADRSAFGKQLRKDMGITADKDKGTKGDESKQRVSNVLLTSNRKTGLTSEAKARVMLKKGNEWTIGYMKKLALENNPDDPLYTRSEADIRAFMAYKIAGFNTKEKAQIRMKNPWIPGVQQGLAGQIAAWLKDEGEEAEERPPSPIQRLTPGQVEIVSRYTFLPKGSSERKVLLAKNPWIKDYWSQNEEYYDQYPYDDKEVSAYLKSIGIDPEEAKAMADAEYGQYSKKYGKKSGGYRKSGGKKVSNKTLAALYKKMSPKKSVYLGKTITTAKVKTLTAPQPSGLRKPTAKKKGKLKKFAKKLKKR